MRISQPGFSGYSHQSISSYYMSTEIYTLRTLLIKIVRPFLRNNPIGHRFSSHVKNIVWPITNSIRFFSLVKKIVTPFQKSCPCKHEHGFTVRNFPKCQAKNSRYKEYLPKANVKRPNIKNWISINTGNNRLCEGKPCKCRFKTLVTDGNRLWRATKKHFQSTDFI